VEGLRAKEIAAARSELSAKTVDTYRASLMRKLDIHDLAGLVKFAIQRNLNGRSSKKHLWGNDSTHRRRHPDVAPGRIARADPAPAMPSALWLAPRFGDGGPATRGRLWARLKRQSQIRRATFTLPRREPPHPARLAVGRHLHFRRHRRGGFLRGWGAGGCRSTALTVGMAFDGQGNLHIADSGNHRIRRVTPQGIISTATSGTPAIPLRSPRGVAFDATGNLYATNAETGSLVRMTPSGQAEAILTGMLRPGGVAVEADGNIVVADTGHHIIAEGNSGRIRYSRRRFGRRGVRRRPGAGHQSRGPPIVPQRCRG